MNLLLSCWQYFGVGMISGAFLISSPVLAVILYTDYVRYRMKRKKFKS